MSTRRIKLTTAAGVLAAGFALATLVGRRPASSANLVADSHLGAELAPHGQVSENRLRPATESPLEIATSSEPQDETLNAMRPPRIVDDSTGATSPGRLVAGVATQNRPRAIRQSEPPSLPRRLDTGEWNAAVALGGTAGDEALDPDEANLQPVSHVIHNGDTLERLARRYLKDERRAVEIFELNRDVLKNPHILPIGAELQIPAPPAEN